MDCLISCQLNDVQNQVNKDIKEIYDLIYSTELLIEDDVSQLRDEALTLGNSCTETITYLIHSFSNKFHGHLTKPDHPVTETLTKPVAEDNSIEPPAEDESDEA